MTGLRDRAQFFARTANGFRDLLKTPPLTNPQELIRTRLRNRGKNFLELIQRAVFEVPTNPFREMFSLAGCEYGDLAGIVNRDGIEAALTTLHRQGVYLSHDEFKLKKPIVRSNRTIAADENSFRNPLSRGGTEGATSGSRSTGTKVRTSTEARRHREVYDRLSIDELGLARRHHILLKPILPANDGLFNIASHGRIGCKLDRWFSPVARSADSLHYRLGTLALVAMARAYGFKMPVPTHLPHNDFAPVARWLARRGSEGIDTAVTSYASPAVRVASVAADLGLRLDRSIFVVGGETLTEGKRRVIESTGAKVFPRYAITEFGAVGHSCRQMLTGDRVHLYTDSIAALTHRRTAPLSGEQVDSLMLTSLAPHAPFVLINTEMDDSGVLTQATCDCTYSKLGLTTVINDISSFGKLTGHGVTLIGSDVVRILEEVLPARFGGGPADYQLVESDVGSDQTKLILRVSRRVQMPSPDQVKSRFLQELRVYFGGQIASRLLRDAEALQVVHEEPIASPRGKVMLLHLLGPGSRANTAHGS